MLAILVCLVINLSNAAPKKVVRIVGSQDENVCRCRYETIRVSAKRRVCLLGPDTGPCRADIVSWYYDARKHNCYRFFFGGCQGNGNNYRTKRKCLGECYLSTDITQDHLPYFCQLAYDFGTCYGHFYRWHWDTLSKYDLYTCRLYSGCGGNQNNFETNKECMSNCLLKPDNTLNVHQEVNTTCMPLPMPRLK